MAMYISLDNDEVKQMIKYYMENVKNIPIEEVIISESSKYNGYSDIKVKI
jgi:hypothetical protein